MPFAWQTTEEGEENGASLFIYLFLSNKISISTLYKKKKKKKKIKKERKKHIQTNQ